MEVGGALGFRDDISTLCLDSQVGIVLRSQVGAASGLENLTAPSAPIIVIHSYKYLSSQRPTPKQPTHVSSSPRSSRSDILVRRRNWWPTPMTVTHFTTVTNSRLRSRAVETSCSTTSEWSVHWNPPSLCIIHFQTIVNVTIVIVIIKIIITILRRVTGRGQ